MAKVTRSTSATASSELTRVAALAAIAFISLTQARPAYAGEPDCPTASEDGQRARDRGKLLEARELFRICSRTTCPGVVRKDCSKWLSEIEESIPSIVVAARDAAGTDLTEVRIFVDGDPVASRADGKPIPINPGEHVIRFEIEGAPPKTEPVVIRTGEKNRLLRVQLDRPIASDTPAPLPPRPPSPEEPDDRSSGRSTPILGWLFGGIGIVGVGSFAYFGIAAKNDLDNLKSTCAPFCDQGDLDSVKSRMLVADISLGVGIVSLGLATYFFLTHSSGAEVKSVGSR